ncbi:MAG TPA: hypothetical protein VE969_06390 [Pyrinomonadaceae bacterium]|nr:hypothetical protein [Pyrinomonadaceae bacterium]
MLLVAAAFRVAVAHWWPNDAPDDGRVYAQMARNVLEQHLFSHDSQPPYSPSLIRLPGYPGFLAGIYSVFGHTNNGAVRIIQALIDTATCALIALLAFFWQPDEKKKRTTAIAALALAAVCPFTTIYTATILTEVLTNFLMVAMFVAVTIAFKKLTTEDTEENKNNKKNWRTALLWWGVAGLIGGVAVMMRPDSGLFLAAVGLTLVITGLWPLVLGFRKKSKTNEQNSKTKDQRPKINLSRVIASGAALSFTFILVLAPWTIRNWRVFHVFQPLAPAHGEMPGEFVPRGYYLWLRTWLDDQSYVQPFLWSLDTDPIDIDDIPAYAFDSENEKKRVATLIEAYNNESDQDSSSEPQPSPNASPTPTPNGEEEESEPESDKPDNSAQQDHPQVEMTPEIDAAFGELARDRIARHPFRSYVWLPLKRARTIWFDTHAQYWPFEGTLFPLEDLDYSTHQHIWLPLFAGLTAVYTILGLLGAWFLWESGRFDARRWLLLVFLAILLRLILFSWIENPEPRYTVEFFPLLSVLGGIAIAQFPSVKKRGKRLEARGEKD